VKALFPVRSEFVNDTLPPRFEPAFAEVRVPVTLDPERVADCPVIICPKVVFAEFREAVVVPS
jgi:hypothetical protein